MKFILTLLLVALFADASYLRSIRVTSYLDKNRAQRGIIKLKEFVKNHQNLKHLEEKFHFEYKIHTIDKHFLLVIEPLTDKAAVQEILDTLRVKYKKAYPRKLKTDPTIAKTIQKEVLQLVPEAEIQVKQIEPEVIAATKIETLPAITVQEKEKTSPILHDNISKITDNSNKNASKEDISSLLIFILGILLIVSFLYVYFSRRKRKRKNTHSKTLTEILLESKDEIKLKDTKVNRVFEDAQNKQSLMNNQHMIKHEELNTKVGLDSYNNELSTYKIALKNFKEKHATSPILIEKLCKTADFNQALSIMQLLKEESIKIGAFNLHESIKTMEQEIQLGENAQWENSIWGYGITLAKLSTQIDHYETTAQG